MTHIQQEVPAEALDAKSTTGKMVAVTMGTNPDELGYLRESCRRNGLAEQYLELGVNQTWTGFGMRWRLIREWLEAEDIDDDTWVIFNDGYDTACQQPLERILEVLSGFDAGRLVVSSELYPWPEEVVQLAIDQFGPVDGSYKFPCAGQYAGTCASLRHLYETTDIEDGADDQAALLRYLLEHPDRVQFDTEHVLFQPNLYRLRDDIITEPRKKWSKTLNRDLEVREDPADGQEKFFHKDRKYAACFVHSNGCKYSIQRLLDRAGRPGWWPF
jgi:hypothetical protein